ncbi:ketoacyl-ACP synthase III [Chitinispirillales bacterium ANBcel5]|uniref:beta-ketoacyl-ACP synthase III n=1 Tax=Cellulosispirillum alkaliphilum TaxID=3039283 RepID=UPI002A5844D0|nr:ketoacyl-ACP synthase III [Chitinispirillales bacterium ANBcel5]
MNSKRVQILSVGSSVPEAVLTNKDIESFLDTSDEWITVRTGIKQRHIIPKGEDISAADLGTQAASQALKKADIEPQDVDGIVCATFTPDYFFPSTACRIQAALGCKGGFAFDISAACAGFVYALTVANNMILCGQAKTMIVVGSEIISKTLDWTDRNSCILFGDGAGAVVLQAKDDLSKGIMASHIESDGNLGDILKLPAWGDKRFMQMRGNEVFKHAVRLMSDTSARVIKQTGIGINDIDLLIPHQANIRIIRAVADSLGFPMEKIIVNLDEYGNTSSASIPIALNEAWDDGLIKEGAKVLFTCLGGGVTVGSALVYF